MTFVQQCPSAGSLADPNKPITLTHPGKVFNVAFTADGKILATSDYEGIVRFWNAETGAAISKPIDEEKGTSLIIVGSCGRPGPHRAPPESRAILLSGELKGTEVISARSAREQFKTPVAFNDSSCQLLLDEAQDFGGDVDLQCGGKCFPAGDGVYLQHIGWGVVEGQQVDAG